MRWLALLCGGVGLALLLTGCENGRAHCFNYIWDNSTSDVEVTANAAPGERLSGHATYVLELDRGAEEVMAQKQLGWLLTDRLLSKGYRTAESPSEADVVIRLSVSNEQRDQYVPPRQTTERVWVPAQTVDVRVYNSDGTTSWGTATVPGHNEDRPVTRPGYTVSRYYPEVRIYIEDGPRLRAGGDALVWEGRASGRTRLANAVLWGQYVLARLASRIPSQGPVPSDVFLERAGLTMDVATPDGSVFYPVATGIAKKSPAARAGVRPYDMITAIDGESTADHPMVEIAQRLAMEPGMERTLTLRRRDGERTAMLRIPAEAAAPQK